MNPASKQDEILKLEEAMGRAFFNHAKPEELVRDEDDPPILDISFDIFTKHLEAAIRQRIAAAYPHAFGNAQARNTGLVDLLNDPRKAQLFFQATTDAQALSSQLHEDNARRWKQIKQRLEQPPVSEQMREYIENIDHRLLTSQAYHKEAVEVTGSVLPMLATFGEFLNNSGSMLKAFDPALAPAERMTLLSAQLEPVIPKIEQNISEIPTAGVSDLVPMFQHTKQVLSGAQDFSAALENVRLPDLSALDDFDYGSLPNGDSIRVLRLLDNNSITNEAININRIELTLQVIDLHKKPKFNALSYAWGDHRTPLAYGSSQNRARRKFDIICNGRKVSITYNLFCFLRRFAANTEGPLKEARATPIWIDQLCINQANTEERNAQVAIMDRIYIEANMVISWLGEEDRWLDLALQAVDIIKDVLKDPLKPSFNVKDFVGGIKDDHWLALASLLSRSYFRRAWVIQEVALASDLILVCGSRIIKWEDLSSCCKFIEESRAWIMLSSYTGMFRSIEEHLGLNRWRPPLRLGQQVSALRKARAAIRQEVVLPEDLFFLGRQFDATEIRDKLYAMRGIVGYRMSPTQLQGLPEVDYRRDLRYISIEYAKYHVKQSQSLRILLFVEDHVYRTQKNLPSWVPDPAARLLPWPMANILPVESETTTQHATTYYNTHQLVTEGDALVIPGSPVGIILKTAAPFNNIIETNEWSQFFDFLLQIAGFKVSNMKLGEAVWRTLTMSACLSGECEEGGASLDREFGDWCASLVKTDSYQQDGRFLQMKAAVLAAGYRTDDLTFDMLAFGQDSRSIVLDSPRAIERNNLLLDAIDKRRREDKNRSSVSSTSRLNNSLRLLWEKDRDDVFPSPAQARRMTEPLESAAKEEIQGRVDRFNIAVEMKLDSRRMFITEDRKLGLGPHSIQDGDEIWAVRGLDMPVVLRRVHEEENEFRLVGAAFVLGFVSDENTPIHTIRLL